MKIHILSVVKNKNKNIEWIIAEFAKRIQWKISFHTVQSFNKLPLNIAKEKESKKLLQACPKNTFRIATDITGESFSSDKLAKKFTFLQESARVDIVFFIGGFSGLSKSLIQEADLVLSFGKMTWPHELAKLMLLEQIYRSQCILFNHPYHRLA